MYAFLHPALAQTRDYFRLRERKREREEESDRKTKRDRLTDRYRDRGSQTNLHKME